MDKSLRYLSAVFVLQRCTQVVPAYSSIRDYCCASYHAIPSHITYIRRYHMIQQHSSSYEVLLYNTAVCFLYYCCCCVACPGHTSSCPFEIRATRTKSFVEFYYQVPSSNGVYTSTLVHNRTQEYRTDGFLYQV